MVAFYFILYQNTGMSFHLETSFNAWMFQVKSEGDFLMEAWIFEKESTQKRRSLGYLL